MLRSIPLMLLALIAYNIIALGNEGGVDVWQTEVMAIPMLSGVTWRMVLGDAMILFGLILLFIEIVKSTGVGSAAILDHALSTFVFIAFLVEFLLVPSAANTIFFTLTLISLIDVIAGFAVSIKGATRDVSFGR
ncbi:MAG: hypothetical protein AAFY73_02410 [Pseudomonadota bacterium]